MPDPRKLRRDFQKATRSKTLRGFIGDGNGKVYVANETGKVYIRFSGVQSTTPPSVARIDGAVQPANDLPVIISYDNTGALTVVSIDTEAAALQGASPTQLASGDPAFTHFVNQNQITTCICYTTATGLTDRIEVIVREGIINRSGTISFFGGERVVLNTYLPVTVGHHCFAVLFIDSSDTVEVQVSTSQTRTTDLDISDIQEAMDLASVGAIPIWAWRLDYATTTLSSDELNIDLRQFISDGAITGTPADPTPEFDYIDLSEATAPGTPGTSLGRVYYDSSDSELYLKRDDGSTAILSSAATETDYGLKNLIQAENSFETWTEGTAVAPGAWTAVGSPIIARNSTNKLFGTYSLSLTRSGGDAYLEQVIDTITSGSTTHLAGTTFTFGCWVYSLIANRSKITIYDGVGSSSSTEHTGSGWEFLKVTRTLNGSATTLTVRLEVVNGSFAAQVFDSPTLVEGDDLRRQIPFSPTFNRLPTRWQSMFETWSVSSGSAISRTVSSVYYMNGIAFQNPAVNGDSVYTYFFLKGGSYTLYAMGSTATNLGTIDWYLDEEIVINGQDWYSSPAVNNVTKSGAITVRGDGLHRLRLVIDGKNASSSAHFWALTTVWIK